VGSVNFFKVRHLNYVAGRTNGIEASANFQRAKAMSCDDSPRAGGSLSHALED
jgi:hypothetical protein